MYTRYTDFPDDLPANKKCSAPNMFSDISNCFFNGFKVIHHSHITRETYGCAHNFCNKQVRELTEKSDQYFSCIFHNGLRFDMTFLTKRIWLSLWKTQDVSLLGSGLTILKSYNIGRHVKFIDSFKYYRQPLPKLVRNTTSEEKKRIKCFFLEFLGFQHPYYSKFFLQELSEDDRNYVLQYLSLGKGCFSYESATGFNSLSATPKNGDFWTIDKFYSRLKDEEISQKEWEGCERK